MLLKKPLPGVKKLSPARKINEQYHFQTPVPLFSQAGFVSEPLRCGLSDRSIFLGTGKERLVLLNEPWRSVCCLR